MIAAYVSGHGFGHSTRTAEVLRAAREMRPDLRISVVTSAPPALFTRVLGDHVTVRRVELDVGLAQRGALAIDIPETARRWRAFVAGYDDLVAREAEWLRSSGARVVLGDIPPAAFDAAAEAGIPGVALGNFSWDWIYAHYAGLEPTLGEAAAHAARAYGRATLLLELPFAGDLAAFPKRERVPLVARRPRVAAEDVRDRLGLRDTRPLVLLSFGGFGAAVDRAAYDGLDALRVVHSEDVADRLEPAGLEYPDLVGAVDVVVSKPGYGIVSDVIGARRRLVYTDRGDFPEYPILVREMVRWIPAAYVPNKDLAAGRVAGAVRAVLAAGMPAAPPLEGATTAAGQLLRFL